MLVQWILNSIDLSLRKTIPYFEEAHPLWVVLLRRFDVSSVLDELATYDPIPTCRCGFCMYHLGEQFQQKQDNNRLHDFLYAPDVVLTMAVQPPPRGTSQFESRVKCTYCHRSGHDVSSCFSKLGFLEGWGRGFGRGSGAFGTGSASRGRGGLVQPTSVGSTGLTSRLRGGQVQPGSFVGSAMASSSGLGGSLDGMSNMQ
ncbi:hypothetical protein LIER_35317 [Lithospermum erythrorhizon]|uniref:Uncharacterized protein n=1 Tax=Lithospermum erythrorhizon TaxID=34254 RepID=A0AAV3NQ57_LITER